jgi:hypothetical protein
MPSKNGIDEGDDHESRRQLRIEFGALGDAARNDRRDGCRKGQQEEELGQLVTVLLQQGVGAMEEIDAVGDAVADEESRRLSIPRSR